MSVSDAAEQTWFWLYDGHPLYLDREQPVLFRVVHEAFAVPSPPPGTLDTQPDASTAGADGTVDARRLPYRIVVRACAVRAASDRRDSLSRVPLAQASIQGAGLGCKAWWDDASDERGEHPELPGAA